jgi:hypothetical protein
VLEVKFQRVRIRAKGEVHAMGMPSRVAAILTMSRSPSFREETDVPVVRENLRPAREVADEVEDALTWSLDEDGGAGVHCREGMNAGDQRWMR